MGLSLDSDLLKQSGTCVLPSPVLFPSHRADKWFHYKHGTGNVEASPRLCKVTLACRRCGGGDEGYVTRRDRLRVQDRFRWSSVAVEPNGVDCGGDGPSAVAPPLLLCLFVSERFALGELEDVVGFLAPVPVGSPLEGAEPAGSERPGCSSAATTLTVVV